MKTPKLIIADIDDTLVHKGVEMSPLTRETLNKAHDAGIWFCIASGRPLDEVQKSVESYKLGFEPDFVVGMNGGEIQDNISQNTFSQYLLEPEMLEKLVRMMDKQDCNIDMYKDGKLYAKVDDDMVAASSRRAGKEIYIVNDLSEFWDAPNGKIMFRTWTNEKCDELEDWCKSQNIPGVRFFKTQPNLLEVCDARVHKGAALETICKAHGISYDEVIAFGDASNDNEMLELAGTGVCLANGLPDTKAIADEITRETCEHDGLPLWLIEHVDVLKAGN